MPSRHIILASSNRHFYPSRHWRLPLMWRSMNLRKTHLSIAVPDQAPPYSFLLSRCFIAWPFSLRIPLSFTWSFLVLGFSIQKSETFVTEAGIGTEAGKLESKLNNLGRLKLWHVKWSVEHSKFKSAVMADVGTTPFRMNFERRSFLWHYHRPEKQQNCVNKSSKVSFNSLICVFCYLDKHQPFIVVRGRGKDMSSVSTWFVRRNWILC